MHHIKLFQGLGLAPVRLCRWVAQKLCAHYRSCSPCAPSFSISPRMQQCLLCTQVVRRLSSVAVLNTPCMRFYELCTSRTLAHTKGCLRAVQTLRTKHAKEGPSKGECNFMHSECMQFMWHKRGDVKDFVAVYE